MQTLCSDGVLRNVNTQARAETQQHEACETSRHPDIIARMCAIICLHL